MELKDDKGKVIAKVFAHDTNSSPCDEGVWVEVQADDGTRPTLCLIKDKADGTMKGAWYLGVYRDMKKPGRACDLAISFAKDEGVTLQVVKGKDVKVVNLFDLIDKVEKCASC